MKKHSRKFNAIELLYDKTDYPWFKKNLVPHPHELVVRNVSHKFVVRTAIDPTYDKMVPASY